MVSRLHVVLALPTSLVVEPPVERFLLALLLPGRVCLLLALAEVGRVGLPLARPLQPGLRFERALLVADPRRLGQVPGLQGRLETRPEPLLHRHKMRRDEANVRSADKKREEKVRLASANSMARSSDSWRHRSAAARKGFRASHSACLSSS